MQYISVSPEIFSAQMKFLADNDFMVIDLDDFLKWKETNQRIPPKTVILTFDDGFEDNYTNVFPVLKRHSFKAILSIITEYVGRDAPFPWISQSLSEEKTDKRTGMPLSKSQLKALSDYGITIASHTRRHISLSRLDKQKVREEIFGSKKDLEEMLNKRVRYLTYPYGSWGDFDDMTKRLVQSAGYEAALSTKVGHNSLKSDFYELRRIPIFDIDGVANFKRKVRGAYDSTVFAQLLGFKLRRLFNRRG